MGLEFITRIVKTAAVVAAIAGLFVATYVSPASGAGLFLGAIWGAANLLAVASLVRIVVGTETYGKLRIVKAIILKFPILYGLGFLLLRAGVFPTGSLVTGFSLVLAVILLKALGAVVAEKLREKARQSYA